MTAIGIGSAGLDAPIDIGRHGALPGNIGNQTAAIQVVLDALSAQGGGSITGRGVFRCTGALSFPQNVYVDGPGQGAFELHFPTDLGADVEAVVLDGFQRNNSALRGVSITGPGTFAIGTDDVDMNGVYMAQSCNIEDCYVAGFRGGLVMAEDHNEVANCKVGNNYINLLWPGVRHQSKGNQTFYQCYLEGANFACIGVFGDNNLDYVTFLGGNCGQAPYGFYKGDGEGGAVSQSGMMVSTRLISFAFEGIGNAAFYDASTGTGNGADSMVNCTIEDVGFVWGGPTREIVHGANQDYAVNLRNVLSTVFRPGSQPFTTGDVAAYKFASGAGSRVESNFATTAVPVFDADCALVDYSTVSGGTRGRLLNASGTITAGDLVEYYHSGSDTVRRYSATVNFEYAGVALSSAVDGATVLVAFEGQAGITCDTGVNPGWAVKPSSTTSYNGMAAPNMGFAAAAAATLSPVVGVCLSNGGPGLVTCRLVRQHDRNYVKPGLVTALPTAAVAYRGQMLRVEGGAGVADTLNICEKNAANAYVWRAI